MNSSMFDINTVIKNIISDSNCTLVGYYGSYADSTQSRMSDIDLFIILKELDQLNVEGVHYQSDVNEIDFLLISEELIHSGNISSYLKYCILNSSKIIHSSCNVCFKTISEIQKLNDNHLLSDNEYENIYWHLKHIILKARRFQENSIELVILWSKFIYFLSLLWPRFNNKAVKGELVFLKSSYGVKLKEFISKSKHTIPPVNVWDEFLNNSMQRENINSVNIFCEVDNLIQPYTPIITDQKDKNGLKKIVKQWMQ